MARCPAHEDRAASLSIGEGPDGRILLHCFALCSAVDVVHALGLEWRDLFPKRITRDMTPAERSAMREGARQAQWRAALGVLERESTIVLIAARSVRDGPLSDADDARLAEAVERIEQARGVLCAR